MALVAGCANESGTAGSQPPVADRRRHSHASHAIMGGESLHVTGRMLGHRRPDTTDRYAHLGDATFGQAAQRMALAVADKLTNNDQQESVVL